MRTVSFTLCSKKCGPDVATSALSLYAWLQRLAVLVSLLVLVLGWAMPAHAESVQADTSPLVLERSDDGVFLTTTVSFELPATVDDVLRKGIPVHFVAEAALFRDRWYWSDKRVASASRYMRLAYQPLVRRWRLQVGTAPIGNNGLGVTLSQNFESLPDALTAIQRFSRWRIGNAADLDADNAYNIDFKFRLDVAQLPRPFQIGVAGQTEWSIAVERNQKIPPNVLRPEAVRPDPPKVDGHKADSLKPEGATK